MDIRERLRAVPGSYDDFVSSTARWMEKDDRIKSAILDQLEMKPDSSTKDIMNVLCDLLGIGEPVDLVDEDEYESGYEEKVLFTVAG